MTAPINVQAKAGKLADINTDALIVGLFEGKTELAGALEEVDAAAGGALKGVLASGDFKGKPNQTLVLYAPGTAFKRVVLVGLGKDGELTLEKIRCAGGKAATTARDLGAKHITVHVPGVQAGQWKPSEGRFDMQSATQAVAEGALLALYQMNEFRTKDREELKAVDAVTFWSPEAGDEGAIADGLAIAKILWESVSLVRDLVARPGNVVTATVLADEAKAAVEPLGVKTTIYDKAGLEKLGFGGVLAVNQGSVEPPRFIVMEWNGGKAGEAPIAIVGKGITFDTGGISIKPGEGMDKMKYDMAGGAAAIGILRTVAALKLPINVVGLVPATDNMPSGNALKPGDVITSYSGQTVEVLNTDAEGRLILMDAITYAVKDLKAKAIFDMATLTGACVVALGTEAIGVLGNNQELVDRFLTAGDKTGDRGWQMPLWKEYNELLRSDIADMKNIGGREAGTITAACFLQRFAGDTPWVHLDIAGTAWTEKDKPYRPKGPTAMPVRAIVELLRNWKDLGLKAGTGPLR
jgi:leucyl aminopeptidase